MLISCFIGLDKHSSHHLRNSAMQAQALLTITVGGNVSDFSDDDVDNMLEFRVILVQPL